MFNIAQMLYQDSRHMLRILFIVWSLFGHCCVHIVGGARGQVGAARVVLHGVVLLEHYSPALSMQHVPASFDVG